MKRDEGLLLLCATLAMALVLMGPASARAQSSYQLFESGQVRPLALSEDGLKLFAVNTPDGQLEIFDVAGPGPEAGQLTHSASVQVGVEPVAVAVRSGYEVWVVNHISDSISIVALSPTPRVVRTLLVGDEPRDIIFAGTDDRWGFITTAHRGQHSSNGGRINRTLPDADDESEPHAAGTPRADVWVFDTLNLGTELGGTPAALLSLFGDKPRALARNLSGDRVYAAILHSGNRSTTVPEGLLCDTSNQNLADNLVEPGCVIHGVAVPGGYPTPHSTHAGAERFETGLIVQYDRPGGPSGVFSDELGRDWNAVIKFDLPDRDVFEIDASLDPPAVVDASATCANGAGCWARVGTTIFNMAVNPISGKIYVSNTDAGNHVRFEGPGIHASGPNGKEPGGDPATLRGDLARSQITVLDGAMVAPRHLNKHLDYSVHPTPAADKAQSFSTPVGMEVSADGTTLYVAALGSDEIAVYDTAELEADSFDPEQTLPAQPGFVGHIALNGGGPTGVVLGAGKLYALTRFDNSVRVIDTTTQSEEQSLALHSPEPADVIEGRPFLYSAKLTSSNGEASCAACHIFADLDALAWDLGNPDGDVVANTNPMSPVNLPPPADFHPMKGPMATQSLRGLANMGPQHWRGDRQGDETLAFEAFNGAFPSLLGRNGPLSAEDMTRFRRFALQLRYPPNPIQKLDGSLRPDEAAGAARYSGGDFTDGIAGCAGCHPLEPAQGFFGADGKSLRDLTQGDMKLPHLRNLYQKVGMFGMSEPQGGGFILDGDFSHQGPQVRGFGLTHDGAIDMLARFLAQLGFTGVSALESSQLSDFVMAFPSDLAPAVGQQITLNSTNFLQAEVAAHIDLLIARAEAPFSSQVLGPGAMECDLVASVVEGGRERGYLYDPVSDLFRPDDLMPGIVDAALRAKAETIGQEVTYTCATPGAGPRLAHDRDQDGLMDGFETATGVFVSETDTGTSPTTGDTDGDGFGDAQEVMAGSDPNDPLSVPGKVPAGSVPSHILLALALLSYGVRTSRGRYCSTQ